jgi:hypothetical protein
MNFTGPGEHLPLAPGFSRSGEHVGSRAESDGVPTLVKATPCHQIPTRLNGDSDTGLLRPGFQSNAQLQGAYLNPATPDTSPRVQNQSGRPPGQRASQV